VSAKRLLTKDGDAWQLEGLPDHIQVVLSDFLSESKHSFGDDLIAAILFGSAADGTLSSTSDVNLLLVLRSFTPDKVEHIRESFLAADAAIQLRVMFLLEPEIEAAVELFAQKFADILRRRRVIYGRDVFSGVQVPREAEKFRLRQVLLNLTLRLREAYALNAGRGEQVVRLLADTLGPIRAASATLLELEGIEKPEGNAALRTVAASFGDKGGAAAAGLFSAHSGSLASGDARTVLVSVIDLTTRISERASRLA
jgi:predicted nucleotidyltransferase